ncbi:MAG: hypothetical protein HRT45_12240 [Bdellovibrionales bacterium]|nr:hypothetical protein [Bdellovibrionales bacterium]
MAGSTTDYVAMTSNYTDLTKGAQKVIEASVPLADKHLADNGFFQGQQPATFLDLGAADGGTAVPLWRALLTKFRENSAERPATLVSNDLPGADFNTLFRVYETGEADSLRQRFAPFYVLGNGTPFFQQAVENGSIDFSYSATAMHWLSSAPAKMKDHVHQVESQDACVAEFRDLANQNWSSILKARWAELKPGGIFFAVNFCVSTDNTYLGKTTGKSMFSTFSEIWKSVASEQEFVDTNFPQYYRSKEELETGAAQLGFEVLDHQIVQTNCPYKERFLNGDWTSAEYAENFLPTMTTWSTAVFKSGLRQDRSEDDKTKMINELWGTYKKLIENDPESYQMDYVHSFLVLRKPSGA